MARLSEVKHVLTLAAITSLTFTVVSYATPSHMPILGQLMRRSAQVLKASPTDECPVTANRRKAAARIQNPAVDP